MASLCPACARGTPRFACKALLYRGCEREIWDCPDCGAAFFHPTPAPEDIARCYPPVYFRDFLKQYWKDLYKGKALALRLSSWRRQGDLLDVGCALGTMLAGAREGTGWRVHGLEFSADACALGRRLNGVEIEPGGLSRAPGRTRASTSSTSTTSSSTSPIRSPPCAAPRRSCAPEGGSN